MVRSGGGTAHQLSHARRALDNFVQEGCNGHGWLRSNQRNQS